MTEICHGGFDSLPLAKILNCNFLSSSSGKKTKKNVETTKISGSKSTFGMHLWHHLWRIFSATPESLSYPNHSFHSHLLPSFCSIFRVLMFLLCSWAIENGWRSHQKRDLPTALKPKHESCSDGCRLGTRTYCTPTKLKMT